ncbi:U-box domain-containing protein 62-like isoform X2 [Hibiscus syriacus]|uniref:U-box domain-containing protein 62-like isoform X2 n=1 Tax=Hibiscus syriacus TaxID=106335 RepID=UPI0019245AE8|nr:U-box domain-containing protein 62-like isoform X2 [Hibiscus syriacus]
MSSEEISLQNGPDVFQANPIRTFNCGPPITNRPGSKIRELTGFIDDKIFSFLPSQPPEFRSSNIFAAAVSSASTDRRDPPNRHHRNWERSAEGCSTNSGEDESDGDDVDDEDDDDDDGEDGDQNDNNNNRSNSININNKSTSGNETVSNAGSGNPENMGNGKAKHPFVGGSCRELVVKEGGIGLGVGDGNTYQNAVTIADPSGDIYYTQYLQGGEGSAASGGNGQKDILVGNGGGGCGFSGRKDVPFMNESGESLRTIFSDPVTGALMDDAMILPCGHSFGAAGIQHVLRMKVCYTCSQSVSEESVAPNLSLRAAVQAFRQEEELQFYRSPKRRRERFDQDKSSYGESIMMDLPRGRGVQFPFAVTDRVIIKGNKRTPPRFVGREAVVTTQCLNGWYVVKTLDNAESVKLQYRSLAKVADETSSSKATSSKAGPNWL